MMTWTEKNEELDLYTSIYLYI